MIFGRKTDLLSVTLLIAVKRLHGQGNLQKKTFIGTHDSRVMERSTAGMHGTRALAESSHPYPKQEERARER